MQAFFFNLKWKAGGMCEFYQAKAVLLDYPITWKYERNLACFDLTAGFTMSVGMIRSRSYVSNLPRGDSGGI